MVFLTAFVLCSERATAQVSWRTPAVTEDLGDATPQAQLESLLGAESSHVFVRFSRTLQARERATATSLGLELKSSLGDHSYFASLSVSADANRLVTSLPLISARPIEARWKLHPALADGRAPEFSVVDASPLGEPIVAVCIALHPGTSRDALTRAVEREQGKIVSALVSLPVYFAQVPLSGITRLAQVDEVQWIEPPLPALEDVNDSNRVVTQADDAQSLPYDLDGTGVTVLVFDGGSALDTHSDFGGRLTVRDNSPLSSHATHVSGTIGGDGTGSAGQFRGMAPGVVIESYGVSIAFGGQNLPFVGDPGDTEADYSDAINQHGADIANNSIGANVSTNGFPCDIIGDYGVMSALIDSMVRGSLGRRIPIVWANGNERQSPNCGDLYATIAPPATAKNHITVGALNSNDDSMTSFSGWGPTDDGRLKPDVSGPGCQSNDDGGVTSTTADGNYGQSCGTSMSAPTVTGLSALLLQEHRMLYPSELDPDGSMLKVLLAHNAVDGGNPGPDYQYGYGSVRIIDTIDFMATGNHLLTEVDHGDSYTFTVEVPAGAPEFKVTLAWDDAPGTPNVIPALTNDLDLVVTNPSGTQAFPWTLDPANPAANAVQTQADHLNNIEQVFVSSPQAGTWQVTVFGFDVPEGPQRFSVTTTPEPTALVLELPEGAPETVAPGQAAEFDVRIRAIGEVLLPGQQQLFYRFDGGAFQSAPLVAASGDRFTATLPSTTCGTTPEFYVSAAGSLSGVATLPRSAPASFFATQVIEVTSLFTDDFEADLGWTVGDVDDDATTGIWERVDPNGTAAQPANDFSPVGVNCFITGQGSVGGGLGENDVDGGKTTLFSPVFDLTSSDDALISYYRWFSNNAGADPNTETFTVDISNDGGGAWTNVETIGPAGEGTSGSWIYHEFRLGDIVPATNQVQLRFITQDPAPGSVVEAGLDEFAITIVDCQAGDDCNSNSTPDAEDISNGTSLDANGNGVPDECECATPLFVRGDANGDLNLDITDPIAILDYLFGSGTINVPLEAANVDDNGSVNIADVQVILNYIFGTGPAPSAPFPSAGCDPTP